MTGLDSLIHSLYDFEPDGVGFGTRRCGILNQAVWDLEPGGLGFCTRRCGWANADMACVEKLVGYWTVSKMNSL